MNRSRETNQKNGDCALGQASTAGSGTLLVALSFLAFVGQSPLPNIGYWLFIRASGENGAIERTLESRLIDC
jgi:hypothetical protein